uniref:Ku domain-containing protein n=1 Tax=Gongylonema pulchrum TaxID=637853 RepID=A0A183CZF3_9BILA
LYLSRRLQAPDSKIRSFYIGALDRQKFVRLAVARVDVTIEKVPANAPKFTTLNYFKHMDRLPPQTTVLRVTARYVSIFFQFMFRFALLSASIHFDSKLLPARTRSLNLSPGCF